jgi:Putative MetA-pathway of phenol degradation
LNRISGILLLSILAAGAVWAQSADSLEFGADRPGIATPPNIAAEKTLQIENGFQYEHSSIDGLTSENILFSSLVLRYGLSSYAELRLQTDVAYSREQDSLSNTKLFGLNPVTIGAKIKLCEQRDIIPDLSVLVNLTLPYFGKSEFRPDNYIPSCYLLFAKDLTEELNLCDNVGVSWNEGSPSPTYSYALCLGLSLNDHLSTFVEAYGFLATHAGPDHYFDAGFAYLLSRNLQVDVSAAGALSSSAGYVLLGAGIAWRL